MSLSPPTPDALRSLRARLGLTQVELASALGISVWTLRAWEQGRQPPPAYLTLALRAIRQPPIPSSPPPSAAAR